ncbi:MAG: hypothetical protein ABL308_09175 [Oceanicaulis sp.]
MAQCDQCGNDYHDPLTVSKGGQTFTFDSFECAAQKLAPNCANCGVRVLGHGLETGGGTIYCCGNCAESAGAQARA